MLLFPSSPFLNYALSSLSFSGTLYDTVAGVPSIVNLHLRDSFGNLLQSGGLNAELALLGVGGEKSEFFYVNEINYIFRSVFAQFLCFYFIY